MPFIKTRLERFKGKTAKSVFTEIYEVNEWGSIESASGKGSTMDITSIIRDELPKLFSKYNIKRLYDGACGDFNWFKDISHCLEYYQGVDIVLPLIRNNSKKYNVPNSIEFRTKNLITEPIINKKFDAILLRDVLVHLPNESIKIILDKISKSGIKYLIITNFNEQPENIDLESFGLWRPVNLKIEPYNLGEPIDSIHESNQTYKINETEYTDKYLCIWENKSIK